MTVIYNPKNSTTSNTITITGTGSSGSGVTLASGTMAGSYLVANGTTSASSYTWANPNTNFNSSNGTPVMTIPYNEDKVIIEEKAALEVKGKLKLNGQDLEERLKTIEYVLGLPERDVTIEAKYPSLKKKYDDYVHSLAKYRTFEAIKGDSNGTT